ncbi:MAG: PAS domain-containing protein [Planctomycetota bacterium]
MPRGHITVRDDATSFELRELFFSTTNTRGIIGACNNVFARLSGYQTDELIGAAHSIVRHPDMPSSVFRLFWKRLNAGKPIAAYVKNLASDGTYYWVMAMATPVDGGFLSVRLKPTSDRFAEVQRLYAEMLSLESASRDRGESKDVAMDCSMEHMMQGLKVFGHETYESFMRDALVREVTQRQTVLRQERQTRSEAKFDTACFDESSHLTGYELLLDDLVNSGESCNTHLNEMLASLDDVDAFQTSFHQIHEVLLEESDVIGILAINAVLSADSAGQEVISQILSQTKHETQTALAELLHLAAKLNDELNEFSFDVAIASLQNEITLTYAREIHRAFNRDPSLGDSVLHENSELISMMMQQCDTRIAALSRQIEQAEELFWKPVSETNRLCRGARTLDYVRLAGKKEACRLGSEHSFRTLFDTLQPRIDAILEGCQTIQSQVSTSVRALSNMRQTKVLLDAQQSQRDSIQRRLRMSRLAESGSELVTC